MRDLLNQCIDVTSFETFFEIKNLRPLILFKKIRAIKNICTITIFKYGNIFMSQKKNYRNI